MRVISDDQVRMFERDPSVDERSGPGAVECEPVIAQPLDDEPPDHVSRRVVTTPRWERIGVPEARERRDDNMERVGRITAETGRVCESFGEPDHLEIATRPAMGEHDRKGIVADTYEVDRMQAPPVDVGGHLVEFVEPTLLQTPVESLAPVVDQIGQEACLGPVRPVISGGRKVVGKTRELQPLCKIVEDVLRHLDLECPQLHRPSLPIRPDDHRSPGPCQSAMPPIGTGTLSQKRTGCRL